MSESSVNVTEGSGKRLHTWDQTISSVLVQDQFVVPGEYPLPSYVASPASAAIATSSAHVVQLMAGSSAKVRIRRISISQYAAANAAGVLGLHVFRLTSAGTGGTSYTPLPLDSAEAACGATCQTLPSSKGTEAANPIFRFSVPLLVAPSTNVPFVLWEQHPSQKPLIIPSGTANGICLKIVAGTDSTATVVPIIEFVETTF